jgi:pyruvate dehydrogenase E2 component (dihydrolipoamide acetyltransferase)
MTDILMPRLSDSMESGVLVQWLIEDGAEVRVGDELVEIETDKATMTYQAQAAGTLEIVAPAGSTVAVGKLIARVGARARTGKPDRTAEALAAAAVRSPSPAPGPIDANGAPAQEASAAAPGGDGDGEAAGPVGSSSATPLARRLARVHGVALEGLAGSGPRGRVTKMDVLRAAGLAGTIAPVAAAGTPAVAGTRPGAPARRELTRTQRLIAQRMTQAKATIPHFQVQTEAAMDEALALRARLRGCAEEQQQAPSLNDLIIKASAIALARHPLANASFRDGAVELHERINIGVAVAAEGALIVPTIFDADAKSLGQIARESRRLAQRVRSGEITPPELSGATFTVSNLGMYGMTAITPVINPPQAAILGVGATRSVFERDAGGEIVERTRLTLTLSCDHRILYGADAARFLGEIRDLLQQPLRILL